MSTCKCVNGLYLWIFVHLMMYLCVHLLSLDICTREKFILVTLIKITAFCTVPPKWLKCSIQVSVLPAWILSNGIIFLFACTESHNVPYPRNCKQNPLVNATDSPPTNNSLNLFERYKNIHKGGITFPQQRQCNSCLCASLFMFQLKREFLFLKNWNSNQ